jgi:glutamate-1-semialdehyde 2,1-aminomutase
MMGKVLGGGLPVGAVGGRAEHLDRLAPVGDVYQAGTLSGNPVAMAAGIATLSLVRSDPAVYDRIQNTARSLVQGLVDAADRAQIPLFGTAIGGLAGFFFTDEDVVDYEAAAATDPDTYAGFFRGMLEHGIYLPPSRFEALFLSAAHSEEHIDRFVDAARHVFALA